MTTGQTYVVVNQRQTWKSARDHCQNMGGDLAAVRTIKDQQSIEKFVKATFPEVAPVAKVFFGSFRQLA